MMELRREPRRGLLSGWVALFEGGRGTLLTLLLVPLLVGLALWLPPVSLGDALLQAGYTALPADGGTLADPDGATFTLPAEALAGQTSAQFVSASRQAFIEGTAGGVLDGAASALPPQLIIKSPVYVAATRGPAPAFSEWDIPIPNDSEPTSLLDLYGWDGSAWTWLPHELDREAERLRVRAAGVPQAVAVMQAQRVPAQIGAATGENADFVPRAGTALTFLSPRLYLVQGDGSIGQLWTPSPIFQESGALLVPVLHNVDPSGTVRSDLVDNLLVDPNAWQVHRDRIEELVVGAGYDGIALDFRGIDPALRGDFSRFVASLGERLAAQNKVLVVRVDEPVRVAAAQFDTGAYDWQRLGSAATGLIVPLARTPEALSADAVDALLRFATGQVNRYKLQLEIGAAPYQVIEGEARSLPYAEVVAALSAQVPNVTVPAGEPLSVQAMLPALKAGNFIEEAAATGSYRFVQDGTTVWVEDGATLAERLRQIEAFHLGGVVIADPNQADPAIWTTLAAFQRQAP